MELIGSAHLGPEKLAARAKARRCTLIEPPFWGVLLLLHRASSAPLSICIIIEFSIGLPALFPAALGPPLQLLGQKSLMSLWLPLAGSSKIPPRREPRRCVRTWSQAKSSNAGPSANTRIQGMMSISGTCSTHLAWLVSHLSRSTRSSERVQFACPCDT